MLFPSSTTTLCFLLMTMSCFSSPLHPKEAKPEPPKKKAKIADIEAPKCKDTNGLKKGKILRTLF